MKYHLLFSAAALVCGAAFAQDQAAPAASPSTQSVFDSLDTNKDGRISSEEAQAQPVVSRSFSKADANGDGAITSEEFSTAFTTRSPDATPPPPAPPDEGPSK